MMKNKVTSLIKLVLSMGVIALIATQTSWSEVMFHVSHLSFGELCVFSLIIYAVLALGAVRWQIILKMSGYHIPLKDLYLVTIVGHLFSQCLPSSVGGDVYRAYALRQAGMPLNTAIIGTLGDRLFGFIGLSTAVLLILPFEWAHVYQTFLIYPIFLIFLCFSALIVALIILPNAPESWMSSRLLRPLKPVQEIAKSLRNAKDLISLYLVAFLTTLGLVAEFVYLNHALDLAIPISVLLTAIPLVFMFASLPISFAGWGLREGAMLMILGTYGISREISLSMSLIYGALVLISALPGLAVWAFVRKTTASAFSEMAEAKGSEA